MHEMHGPRIDLAFGALAPLVIDLDAAIDRPAKRASILVAARIEPGIDRAEEFAGRRRRARAVHVVEHAVAEDAVVIEVVGDGQIEGLIEVAEPFRRPQQDRRCQDREDEKGKNDPGAAGEQPLSHGCGRCHREDDRNTKRTCDKIGGPRAAWARAKAAHWACPRSANSARINVIPFMFESDQGRVWPHPRCKKNLP